MDVKVKIDIEGMKKSLDDFSSSIVDTINESLDKLAEKMQREVGMAIFQKMPNKADSFLKHLKKEKIGDNIWVIYIDSEEFEQMELGYPGFDMKPGFLNSPKAKQSKDNKSYMRVPLPQKPHSKSPASPKVRDMRSAVKSVIKDKTVKKVVEKFNSQSSGLSRYGNVTRYKGIEDSRVKGLVAVQPPGGKKQHLLFRTVSESSSEGSWMHPGVQGINIFEEINIKAEKELDKLMKDILGG